MSLIRFHTVTKKFDARLILRDVFFRLESDDRVGLIGKNGTGKTTVLRLILGQEDLTSGSIDTSSEVTLGYFSQFSELKDEVSVVDVLIELFAGIRAIEIELKQIDTTLSEIEDENEQRQALRRQGELHHEMDRLEGWTYANRIDIVLTKLGFSGSRRTQSFSLPAAILGDGLEATHRHSFRRTKSARGAGKMLAVRCCHHSPG